MFLNHSETPWWQLCWKCRGTASMNAPGRKMTLDEIRESNPALWAEIMVEGGWVAERVKVPCTVCRETGYSAWMRWRLQL